MKAVVLILLLAVALQAHAASVSIDPTQDRHVISDLIYGVNFASDQQIDQGVTMTRWGGNAVTSYNYLIDVGSRGLDYFFEKIPGCWSDEGNWCNPAPSATEAKENSGANTFLTQVENKGVSTFFTIPTIGWVPRFASYSQNLPCSFPADKFATQDCFDPYQSDPKCGSGTNGANDPAVCGGSSYPITFPFTVNRSELNTQIDPDWIKTWVEYIVTQFGDSNGKRIYQLDNEPNLWSSTHNDLHPTALTYDELWTVMRDYAEAILEADPTALIAGPAEWGWLNYLCSDEDLKQSGGCSASSADRAAHQGKELMAWLLEQAADYEQQNGKRILHYLDLHYYPQGGNPPDNIQSLWNEDYTDPGWGENIYLLPRMKAWVDDNYPGTKISISEFDFYHHNESVGAVAYAEVLGYFGQYGLDAATAWSPPATDEIAFAAYKLYRNYDGAGSKFFSTSVRASVSGASNLKAFASVGSSALTTVLINDDPSSDVTATVTFGNFQVSGTTATWWMHNNYNSHIFQQADPSVDSDGSVMLTLPPYSISMLIVQGTPGEGGGPIDNTSSNSNSSGAATLFVSLVLPMIVALLALFL